MTTTETTTRVNSVQPHFGRQQGNRLGTLPTGISAVINSTEKVSTLYGQLETDKERKAFFDEFLKRQRNGFGEAWMAIYQTVDLIRANDWYWKEAGFDSFEAFWQEQGQALFGKWAELESTYQYAHMARLNCSRDMTRPRRYAELAQFRGVRLSRKRQPKKRRGQVPTIDCPQASPVELAGDDPMRGFQQGQLAAVAGPLCRFARLRRDAPEVADNSWPASSSNVSKTVPFSPTWWLPR